METELTWLPASEFRRVLNGIDDPIRRCAAFAALTRINTLYMIMRAGSGHLGSSFSAADIVSWLFLNEMRDPFTGEGDLYFSSKGHDAPSLYAALIGLGELDESLLHTLRRVDGLPGHPDVHTPHMPFNTGSLGMGISKAKGDILAGRLLGHTRRVYVLTGDGELQEGQNWEALAGAARDEMGELTVIVDHNKIQSDTWVRDVSDLGDLEGKFRAFGWGVVRCDGHDMSELRRGFRRRATLFGNQPAVIIADTVKGAGCPTFASTSLPDDEWRYRFHSGAPASGDYEKADRELLEAANRVLDEHGLAPLTPGRVTAPAPRPPAGVKFPEIYGEELIKQAHANESIVALDADLVLDTGLVPYSQQFPQRFVECGIAEQDMVSIAGGLAARGLLPFVHSFSCFLHARPNEHIYNNATEGRKVVYVGSQAGLLPATPGHSHQAVRDIGALAAVPDLVVLEPASPAEVRMAVAYCVDTTSSVYLRLASGGCPPEVANLQCESLVPGRGAVIRSGGPIVAIGAGPVMLTQLLRAADMLARDGIDLTVINLPWLNVVDSDWLKALAATAERLFVVDNHYSHGGQADRIARSLLELDPPARTRFSGIGITTLPRCGTDDEVLRAHGLHAQQLAHAIRASAPRLEPA